MKVIKEIDRGGFGRVEEVELVDGTIVAKKTFDPNSDVLASSSLEKLKSRFKREVRTQSILTQELFIPILEFDLEGNDMWYTMPLCERNYQTQISEDRANNIVPKESLADIINALEELHNLGYVHRDLNPRNILLHEGRWKLSDFGLVSPTAGETTNLTSTLSGWGTPFYCAPEQIQDFKQATPRADIYAFGCILHDIFSGNARVPYSQQTTDGPVGVLVEKCTDLNQEKRFKTISATRGALFTLLAKPVNLTPSVESSEWVARLEKVEEWTELQLHDFAKFVNDPLNFDDLWSVLTPLTIDSFKLFINLDEGYTKSIAVEYCDWIIESDFDYEFCDVLVNRLLFIFSLDSLECKSRAVLAVANLGKKHNRFYVMRQLMKICGETLELNIAKRIAIEIQVSESYWDFIDSANSTDYAIEDFHPNIFEVLNERVNRYK